MISARLRICGWKFEPLRAQFLLAWRNWHPITNAAAGNSHHQLTNNVQFLNQSNSLCADLPPWCLLLPPAATLALAAMHGIALPEFP
jgi:hypothetical protein